METCPDLDSLFVHFDDKISNVCAKLAMLDIYLDKNKDQCLNLNSVLGNIQCMLHDIDESLKDAENDFEVRKKNCDQMLEQLEEHVNYIENNLPSPVQQQMERNITYTNMNVKNLKKTKSTATNQKQVSDLNKKNANQTTAATNKPVETKKAPEKKETSNAFPLMEFVTENEFDSIPKYMLSRLSLGTLNESVDAFNATINAKYTFIKNFDVQSTKDVDYKRHKQYKAQENAETKGVLFVTINDIKELSTMKNDATLRKAITCLRHCKRIKEIRGNPPKLIRYGLIHT